MLALTLASALLFSDVRLFDVWYVCDVCVQKENLKLAGWQARLAGRLLRSAVVFGSHGKQYGHVPY